MNRKISIKYTYPKKKYINNGKIKMENEDYFFNSTNVHTNIKDINNFTIQNAINEINKNFG